MQDSVKLIKGVGEKTFEYLKNASINSVEDLFLCLPKRYIVYSIKNPNNIFEDSLICIKCRVISRISSVRLRGKVNSSIFTVLSEGLRIRVIGFGQEYLKYVLNNNLEIVLYGNYKPLKKEFILREVFKENFNMKIEPIYPISNISNKNINKYILNIYSSYNPHFEDLLPQFLKDKYKLLEYNEYIKLSHMPKNEEDVKQVLRRKKYENYLRYFLRVNALRYYYDTTKKIPKVIIMDKIKDLINSLPYELTADQNIALNDIFNDLGNNKIMNRLIQGDVGCGKTMVAIISAYACVLSGYQVALMVPSEVLSYQHYLEFKQVLNGFNIRISLLNSSIKASLKKSIINDLSLGKIDIIIGTQSLIEDNIKFKNLGLTIIDEQHKFGVTDRTKLINKGYQTDSIFLTATPIPRTLGIKQFGDLDISSIHTMPSGRKKVLTKVCSIDDNQFIFNAIKKNIDKGHQVFVVVPQIKESLESDIRNIFDTYDLLNENILARIGILHGEMLDREKNKVMDDFKNHNLDILVSTTVIEVGIDIKNATLMVIYNAEMFGLASLHQLRGRVGRNELQSGCILATKNTMCERLKVMESVYDCFLLSECDLKLRGPGDLFGNIQSGFMEINDINDEKIIECAKDDSKLLYKEYVSGINEYPIVRCIIDEIKNKNIKLN